MHSCTMKPLAVQEPLQISSTLANITNVKFQAASCGSQWTGVMRSAMIDRIEILSRTCQSARAISLPGVSRWEEGGLRSPPSPKAKTLAYWPTLRRNFSSTLRVSLLPVQAASSVQIASTIFTLGTAFVVPFYTAMIIAPQRQWTKKLMESELPFLAMGAMYLYLMTLSWTPETAGLMFASKYYLPELPGITRMFSSSITVASAWIHLLLADLACARYVYLDGLKLKVETRHSLVFCLMMCPVGIISHVITKIIRSFTRHNVGGSPADKGTTLANSTSN